MKIAVPTSQGYVDDHLACCECFTIYTVDDDYHIISCENFRPSEAGCCVVSPAARLRQQGVTVVLAGNIDGPVYTRMLGFGMEVVRNHHGEADNVVRHYLDKLTECHEKDIDLRRNCDHLNN
jgi:predicted Fe-Mo cluster-binding NifX family protein